MPSPPARWVIPAGLLPDFSCPFASRGTHQSSQPEGGSPASLPTTPAVLPHLPAWPAGLHSLPREELTPGCPVLGAFAGESQGPSWGRDGLVPGLGRGGLCLTLDGSCPADCDSFPHTKLLFMFWCLSFVLSLRPLLCVD